MSNRVEVIMRSLKNFSVLAIALLLVLSIGGCATKAGTGAMVGAASGGLIGAMAGNSKTAAVGAAAGAVVGGIVGKSIDEKERGY